MPLVCSKSRQKVSPLQKLRRYKKPIKNSLFFCMWILCQKKFLRSEEHITCCNNILGLRPLEVCVTKATSEYTGVTLRTFDRISDAFRREFFKLINCDRPAWAVKSKTGQYFIFYYRLFTFIHKSTRAARLIDIKSKSQYDPSIHPSIHFLPLIQSRVVEAASQAGYFRCPSP